MAKFKVSQIELNALFKLADEDLRRAQLDLKEDFIRGAISSSYYVVLHSSRALLLSKGIVPKSHKGVLTMLSKEIIKKSLLPKEYSKKINEMFKERLVADYDASEDFVPKDAKEAIEFAEVFYEKVKKIISSNTLEKEKK